MRGRGGFADVFAATMKGGRAVALKLMRRPNEARAERELEILRELGSTIAPELVATGTTADGRRWIAMEDLGEDTFAHRLEDRRELDHAAALKQLSELAAAIDRMHGAGFIHRDLKPENLFFRDDGSVVLIDFGLGRRMSSEPVPAPDPSLTRTGERMGTLHYMAPEQWEDARSAGPAADIYAFAIIAFELLTGRPPFVGDPAKLRMRHATERPPAPSSLARLSRDVDLVFEHALAKSADDRPKTATAVVAALGKALSSAPQRATTPVIEVVGDAPEIGLVALFSDAPANLIGDLADEHRAVVARVDDGRYVLAMTAETSTAASARAGDRMARAALATGLASRAVVHAAPVNVRTGRRGKLLVSGPDVRGVDGWTDSHASSISYTHAVRDFVSASSGDSGTQPSVFSPIAPETVELVGRNRELTGVKDEITQARKEGSSTLITVLAPRGMGKSRFLGALAREFRSTPGNVHYVRSVHDDPESVTRRLLRLGLSLPLAACSRQTIEAAWGDSAPAPAVQHATLFALGAASQQDPAVRPLLAAPGALRQATARAIAFALERSRSAAPLAVLIDDAHTADHALLDGVELATMNGTPGFPLAIVVTGPAQFESTRQGWATRADRSHQLELSRLEHEDSKRLLSALLHPVEYVPAPVIDRFVELAEGSPANLVELAETIKLSGAIRTSTGTTDLVIASDELLDIAARPLADRIGAVALDNVPASLAPLAQACAVLGDAEVDTLHALQRNLPEDDPLVRVDITTGVARLERLEILRLSKKRFAIRSPLLAEGLRRATRKSRLAMLHRAALAALQQLRPPRLSEIARHAAGCGDSQVASVSHLELGLQALQLHRYVEAESNFTATVDHAKDRDDVLEKALTGRARARYRLQRFDDAVRDLEHARELAAARGDDDMVARLLLEQATATDWTHNYRGSRACVEAAQPLVANTDSEELRVLAQLAEGRSLTRAKENRRAAAMLRDVERLAEALDLYEPRVIALLLLGSALCDAGEFAESAAAYERVIDLCRKVGDDFHLAAAFGNRQALWARTRAPERALIDVQSAIELGRQLGHAGLEWGCAINLSELHNWRGEFELAHQLAERSMRIANTFSAAARQSSALAFARVCAARADPETKKHLLEIDSFEAGEGLTGSEKILVDAVRLSTHSTTTNADWHRLLDQHHEALSAEERIEIMLIALSWARAHESEAGEQWLERAQEAAGDHPLWSKRLQQLSSERPGSHE